MQRLTTGSMTLLLFIFNLVCNESLVGQNKVIDTEKELYVRSFINDDDAVAAAT